MANWIWCWRALSRPSQPIFPNTFTWIVSHQAGLRGHGRRKGNRGANGGIDKSPGRCNYGNGSRWMAKLRTCTRCSSAKFDCVYSLKALCKLLEPKIRLITSHPSDLLLTLGQLRWINYVYCRGGYWNMFMYLQCPEFVNQLLWHFFCFYNHRFHTFRFWFWNGAV